MSNSDVNNQGSGEEIIMMDLLNIAMQDGVISEDEFNLIRNIISHIEEYLTLLDNALEDQIINQQEKRELINSRAGILDKAYLTANEDLIVTEPEFQLLQKLLEIIYELEIKEREKTSQI